MITYEINPDLASINWEELTAIFQLVNWGFRSPDEIKSAFEKSSFTCFVKEEKTIIGFGRTVDDGKYYALLVDVVVHPNHQAKKFGKTIVTKLKDSLVGYSFITLTAAPNKDGFYKKIGWKKQKSAFIFPKDEKQLKEHCEE